MHNDDPRRRPGHRERGMARYSYTYQDLADACGCSVNAVSVAKSRGKFDPHDIVSVARWLRDRGALEKVEE